MSREMLIEVCEFLAEEGAIAEDGRWVSKVYDRLLDQEEAPTVGVEEVTDDEMMSPHAVIMALNIVAVLSRQSQSRLPFFLGEH